MFQDLLVFIVTPLGIGCVFAAVIIVSAVLGGNPYRGR